MALKIFYFQRIKTTASKFLLIFIKTTAMSVSRKLIFLIIIIACLKRASANFKIVGGVLSTIVQTPFQGVYYSNDDFTCSASLISNQFALTAGELI